MDENNKTKEKEGIFSFAKINKYFIFPFLCPIFCMASNYFIEIINNDEGLIRKDCLLAILECSTFTGGGLLYFISSLRDKTEETRDKAKTYPERITSIKLIYNDSMEYKRKNIKIFLILFIMALSVSFFDICEVNSFDKNTFEERAYLIFFISIFSQIILKAKIYNHQILSLTIAFSLFIVCIKYLTHTYYISPYLCLLFIGLVSTLITLIYFVLYSLISNKDISIISNNFYFSKAKTGNLLYLYIALVLIFGTLLQTFSFLVIYYFTPTLFMVTDIMTPFLLWIIKIISNEETVSNKIFNSVGYFIVLIASLIYNEIIICNFCGLNEYTKKYLEKRQKKEYALLKQVENENSHYEDNNNNDEENNNNDGENNNNNQENNNDNQNENDVSYNTENDDDETQE